MAEQYIETLVVRDDLRDPVDSPTLSDDDVNAEFDIRVYATLVNIQKTITNSVNNKYAYIFKINTINRLEKV